MSYNDRIEAAHAAIEEHNEAVGGKDKPGYLDPEKFISCVKASGGTNEKRLSALSHEDLLECMPAVDGIKPRVLAKEIANIFRNSATAQVDEKRPVSGRKAEKMSARELIEAFDPEDSTNSVGQRLKEMSKNQKFIVYSTGRIVDFDTTFKLLGEIRGGYNGRDDVDVNGEIKKVYRLGELPENYADENPLYPDRPLRPDGTCDQTGRSWEGVDLAVRQLIRVAIDEGELNVDFDVAHKIIDAVLEKTALKKLRQRYRKSAVQFDELAKTGNLPTLKIAVGGGSGGSESTNPFPAGKQVVWAQDPALTNSYKAFNAVDVNQMQINKLLLKAKWMRGGTSTNDIAKGP